VSIFIIRGPEASGRLIRTAAPLPSPVLKAMVERAIDAGTTLAIRSCGSEQELLDALRVADHSRGEITLLDPGACSESPRLLKLLPHLRNAYVEVHDDGPLREACIPPGAGQRLAVANGYGAQSYALGLEIALEHLGLSEDCNRVHVGT